ncbi:MAG: hypothetical protein JWM00_4 [Candidatus Saccharibacteria bacterium]|nr:hypothetical protein [Candidatus Saccharibacteria bacterium]
MFRKLVSNLAFSPALIGQLGFYAKRLKKEELTRRLGLIFTVLALVVQSFAVFQPPEAANASSNADFVRGGVTSVPDFLNNYDNSPKLKGLFSSLGITRAEIANARAETIGQQGYYNWSMTSLYSAAQGQKPYTFYQADGTSQTVYNRPMALTQEGGPTYPVFAGYSQAFGWFAIKKDCGNLVTKKQPRAEPQPESTCKNLSVVALDAQRFKFTAKSDVTGDARIQGYTFVIESLPDGNVVHRQRVASTEQSVTYQYERTKPGSYKVSVIVHTSLGDRTNNNCRATFKVKEVHVEQVTAVCSGLKIHKIGRTNIEMTGSATVNQATVRKYTFIIKNSKGKTVKTQVVTTNKLSAKTDAVSIETPDQYTARLTVTTSLGDKTDADCTGKFTITPVNVCSLNPELPASSPECQPCPTNPEIWYKDAACVPTECTGDECGGLIEQKTAVNLDQSSANAVSVLAKASDRISYTVTIENTGFTAVTQPIEEKLEDVLQYATVVDTGGGTFNNETQTLSWPAVEIKAGEKQSRTFMIRLASTIAATNTGTSDAASFDCTMTNTFGNSIDVKVDCPIQKVLVEQVVGELPTTGPRENLIFGGLLLSIVTYFYARTRQTGKEVRLIRRDINAGTI